MNEDCNKCVWRLQTHRMEAPNATDGGSKRGKWRLQTVGDWEPMYAAPTGKNRFTKAELI